MGSALALLLTACPGPDYMPVYFPSSDVSNTPTAPVVDPDAAAALACTLQLTAKMCVIIEGPNLHAGQEEPLCEEHVPPIPIVIEGTHARMRGDLFPDIVVEGHGLPIPITINGRGSTDGGSNLGAGTVSPDGQLLIEGFDFYVNALGAIGRIPDLPLTTGTADAVPGLPALHGQPIGSDGATMLVGSTVLGSIIPAADKYLKGASLQVTFTGTVNPPLVQCSGTAGEPSQFSVMRLVVDDHGAEIAVPIPGNNRLEISSGTFIASAPGDVGPRFTAQGKYRITNIASTPHAVKLPPRVGPFVLSSPGGLNQTLAPKSEMIVHVEFLPTNTTVDAPKTVTQIVAIGTDTFYLVGVALAPQGALAADLLGADGAVGTARVQRIDFGTQFVTAAPLRGYFTCAQQVCGGTPLPTACRACTDPSATGCQLLAVNTDSAPVDEVTAQCLSAHPGSKEYQHIDVNGGTTPQYQVVALRNVGPAPLTITGMTLADGKQSASLRQFLAAPGRLLHGASLRDAQAQVVALIAAAPGAKPATGLQLPVTLPPYDPPLQTTQLFLFTTYAPTDLVGANGATAGVGTVVDDQATLRIETSSGPFTLQLYGQTTIRDIPPLALHFASGFGMQERLDGAQYAFRGVTHATTDQAIPLLASVPASSARSVRITGLRLTGPDAAAFELLDSAEEIAAKPDEVRCTLPHYAPDGSISSVDEHPTPVQLAVGGYDLAPGGDVKSMPLLACVNFHRPATAGAQRRFRATLVVNAQQLGPDKKPLKNPDGSLKQSELHIELLAVIDPLQGPMVFRVSQSMSAIINTQLPSLNAIPSYSELQLQMAHGEATPSDASIMLGAFILDPFDDKITLNEAGEEINRPNDGITGVFRAIDTRPTTDTYDDPLLKNYSNLQFDADAPEGHRGTFFDFPNVPEHAKAPSLRIFTTALSYPGPLAPVDKQPQSPSQCETVDPCSPDGQRKFGDGPTEPGKKGTCTYFYVTAGGAETPSLQNAAEEPGAFCAERAASQALHDLPGRYSLEGDVDFEARLRFWGPTYLHNPKGPLGNKPSLNEFLHINFTTGVLRPPQGAKDVNTLPDARINLGKREYLLNLTDKGLETPRICGVNTKNRPFGGTLYSSWRYFAPLLSRDPEGKIPAGCPDDGDASFTGGAAYVHGRPLDPATGTMTVVAFAKFSANPDLTFIFQNAPTFLVLNGWVCDPNGNPEQFEGARCYDLQQNPRDHAAQISVLQGGAHE